MNDHGLLDLRVERPVGGGAMLARSEGRVVLVLGAIPGELVRARIDRRRRDVLHASVVDVLEPDPDRREVGGDPSCGGQVFSHIAYSRQLQLKSEIIGDALRRIAKRGDLGDVPVAPSRERGYRMRARLRLGTSGLGFLREGTHAVCDVAQTGQLLDETTRAIESLGRCLLTMGGASVTHVDVSENMAADQRAVHIHLARPCPGLGTPVAVWAAGGGCTGVSAATDPVGRVDAIHGTAAVTDPLAELTGAPGAGSLIRHASSFFQVNRFSLPALVEAVCRRVAQGPVLDLYAGVGLFAVSLSHRGLEGIIAVERDPFGATDLAANAASAPHPIAVFDVSVEDYLTSRSEPVRGTVIVDPPRTGLSPVVVERLAALGVPRLVYVACDVATFARDLRRLGAAGYAVLDLEAFDMFPNTAHVELVATLGC